MPKIKDLDYLFLSSYVHAREAKLINAERLERMMHAKTDEDAVKVLEECDWGPVSAGSMASFEKKIAEHRQEVFEDLSDLTEQKLCSMIDQCVAQAAHPEAQAAAVRSLQAMEQKNVEVARYLLNG